MPSDDEGGIMDFNMHARAEVVNLLNDAFDVYHVTPDELWIAISRITNVRKTEVKRLALIEEERAKYNKDHRSDHGEELQGISPLLGRDGD
jgi:hypothetical protein